MYKKVLVPLDGSKLAECSLNHVKSMIKEGFAEEAMLLNVVKVDIPFIRTGDEGASYDFTIDINAIRKKAFQASQKYLAGVKKRLTSEGLKVKIKSLEANSSDDAITDYAQKNGMDLIIIATHGYTGISKMLLGSVASGVLHQSHVPVLLIRHESCQV